MREIVTERLGGAAGSTHAANVGKAPEVVFFQRQGAGGATLDTVSVRADGTATPQRRYGGAGGRFPELRLKPRAAARSCDRALKRLPRRLLDDRGSPPPGGAQYLLRYRGARSPGRAGGHRARGPARRASSSTATSTASASARVETDVQTHSQ